MPRQPRLDACPASARHPVPYIMRWAPMNRDFRCAPTVALMESKYFATEKIGKIFLNVWPIFAEQMPWASMREFNREQ